MVISVNPMTAGRAPARLLAYPIDVKVFGQSCDTPPTRVEMSISRNLVSSRADWGTNGFMLHSGRLLLINALGPGNRPGRSHRLVPGRFFPKSIQFGTPARASLSCRAPFSVGDIRKYAIIMR